MTQMMNVPVTVATAGLKGFSTSVSCSAGDRVGDVAEKVSCAQLLGAFTEFKLLLDGAALDPTRTVGSYLITEASKLRFELEADEQSVVRQLQELLDGRSKQKEKSLTIDELALLYCYRYGLSVNAALKTLGLESTLQQLLDRCPDVFRMEGKRVYPAKMAEVEPEPAVEVRVPEPKPVKMKREKMGKAHKVEKTTVTEAAPIDETAFQALHTTISGRSFHSRAVQDLRALEHALKDLSFLQVKDVARGGSVGRGTACMGCEDAELVFFVDGLPAAKHEQWLPRLYKAIAAALEASDGTFPRPAVARETCVTFGHGEGASQLRLRVAPSFCSYAAAVQTLGLEPPESRPYFEASFVKERSAFIHKQPGSVKAVMRLLKWWREQQAFTCELTTPTDELLELVAVYVSQQCGRVGLGQQVSNCMGLLANLSQVRIIWSQYYSPSDIWNPLMSQRPLLMDPVNPFRNVLDPQLFDPRELSTFARTTQFW